MCLLIESIKIIDGRIINPEYHQERVNRSIRDIFKRNNSINLVEEIKIPDNLGKGLFKCRVLYDLRIKKIEFINYKPKKTETLKIVHKNDIEYSYKYKNRLELIRLLKLRGKCDDILIVRNNLITDTSFCNIIFYDGISWITPSTPLLKGTQREFLLDRGIISEYIINVNDLANFTSFKLVNSMIDFEASKKLPVGNIFFQ